MASSVVSREQSEISDDRETSKYRKRSVASAVSDDSYKSNRKFRTPLAAYGQRRKAHPLLVGPNPGSRRDYAIKYRAMQNAPRANLSEINQRVMSAKLHKMKQLQNELSETQLKLEELVNENRLLKSLQKRQEGALKKYEGNNAELPQLLRTHNEDLRILQSNNKQLKVQLRETSSKLRERENEIESLKDNNTRLRKLIEDKNLLEREELHKKLQESQKIIAEQEDKIQMLSRKIMLEAKNSKHQINLEANKHKDTQRELNTALCTITRLEGQLLAREKLSLLQPNPVPKGAPKPKPTKAVSKVDDLKLLSGDVEDEKNSTSSILEKLKAETAEGLLSTLNMTEDNTILKSEIFLEKLKKVEGVGENSPKEQAPTKPSAGVKKPIKNIIPNNIPELNESDEDPILNDEIFMERLRQTETKQTELKSDITEEQKEDEPKLTPTLKRIIKSGSKNNTVQTKTDPYIEAELARKKLTQELADNVVPNKDEANTVSLINKARINSLYEEIRSNVNSLEHSINEKLKDVKEKEEVQEELRKTQSNDINVPRTNEIVRSVTKRKMDQHLEAIFKTDDIKIKKEVTFADQKVTNFDLPKLTPSVSESEEKKIQKMNMTWDAVKDKVRKEREKAEEVMKKLGCDGSDKTPEESDSEHSNEEDEANLLSPEDWKEEPRQHVPSNKTLTLDEQLRKLTDDKIIYNELKKADDLSKQLKTESQKTRKKPNLSANSSGDLKTEKRRREITSEKDTEEKNINFRSESFKSSNALDNFQAEHQKQNLLKALKAIDVGKDPDASTDESEDGLGFGKIKQKFYSTEISASKLTTTTKSKSDLMKELFGK